MRRKKMSKLAISAAAARIKAMPIQEVRRRLAALNVDPQPTIDAVKAIVADAVAAHRGILHEEAEMTARALPAVVTKPTMTPTATTCDVEVMRFCERYRAARCAALPALPPHDASGDVPRMRRNHCVHARDAERRALAADEAHHHHAH